MQELYEALAKAQGEFPVIPKDSKVDVKNKEGRFLYSYRYADLTAIINATRPALSKHGLSFSQGFHHGHSYFRTTIRHSSGQEIDTGLIPATLSTNLDGKEIAAAVTYLKRVSLTAALGVSADEDMDAASEDGQHGRQTIKTPDVPIAARYAPPADIVPEKEQSLIDRITKLAKAKNVTNDQLKKLIEGFGKKKSTECSPGELEEILAYLENK